MKWRHIFKTQYKLMFSKILKQQFTCTIKLSQIDSSPEKAHNTHRQKFCLTPLHRAAQLPNVKNP